MSNHPNFLPATPQEYVQAAIIGVLVEDLIADGWLIDVNDNDADRETHLSESGDKDAVMAAIFNPELDSRDYCLDLRRADRREAGVGGWVRLIDGNGASVISDFTTNLTAVMDRANKLSIDIDRAGEDTWVMVRLLKSERTVADLLAALQAWKTFAKTPPSAADTWAGVHIPTVEFNAAQELTRAAIARAEG